MAYWIPINKGEVGYSAGDFRCTKCGKPNPCYRLTDFCPNCGEAMQTTKGMTPIEKAIATADCPWK